MSNFNHRKGKYSRKGKKRKKIVAHRWEDGNPGIA